MTEIAELLACMRRIEKHLAHIAGLLDSIIKHGEAAPFVEWAEPPEQHQTAVKGPA